MLQIEHKKSGQGGGWWPRSDWRWTQGPSSGGSLQVGFSEVLSWVSCCTLSALCLPDRYFIKCRDVSELEKLHTQLMASYPPNNDGGYFQ